MNKNRVKILIDRKKWRMEKRQKIEHIKKD